MGKLKLNKDVVSKSPKRDYDYSNNLSLHSGMFAKVKSFDIGEEITLEVKVKINSLRLADKWQIEEYKNIKEDTEFADAKILSIKEKSNG
jgi:hypothetical protein